MIFKNDNKNSKETAGGQSQPRQSSERREPPGGAGQGRHAVPVAW